MKFDVWVPTGEMMCYTVECENEECAKDVLMAEIDSGKRDWDNYDDSYYADITSDEWFVEEH